jgi:hypothetical protein
MGFLHSYHLDLFVVVFVLGSSPVPIRPFLVCKMGSVIASLRSVGILGVSSFMGFPQLRARPGNHGPLIKLYLLVLFHCFGVCALGSPVVIPAPILCSARCTTIITTPYLYLGEVHPYLTMENPFLLRPLPPADYLFCFPTDNPFSYFCASILDVVVRTSAAVTVFCR